MHRFCFNNSHQKPIYPVSYHVTWLIVVPSYHSKNSQSRSWKRTTRQKCFFFCSDNYSTGSVIVHVKWFILSPDRNWLVDGRNVHWKQMANYRCQSKIWNPSKMVYFTRYFVLDTIHLTSQYTSLMNSMWIPAGSWQMCGGMCSVWTWPHQRKKSGLDNYRSVTWTVCEYHGGKPHGAALISKVHVTYHVNSC